MDCSPRRVAHQRERDYLFLRVDVATEDLSVSADYPGLNKILPHVAPVRRKNFQHPVMIRQGAKWRSIAQRSRFRVRSRQLRGSVLRLNLENHVSTEALSTGENGLDAAGLQKLEVAHVALPSPFVLVAATHLRVGNRERRNIAVSSLDD